MKRLFAFAAVAVISMPLMADEKAKAPEKVAKQDSGAAIVPPEPAGESPLVAAARRSRRGKSTSVVITDEMVKKAQGRLTTTSSDYLPPSLPEKVEQPADAVANQQRAKARADEARRADEAKAAAEKETLRKARLAAAAENLDDGYDDGEDPARVEKDLSDASKQEKKP